MARSARYQRLVDTCVFRRGASAKKACEKMAAAAVGDRGRRRRSGLGAPQGLTVQERETGAKNTFRFVAVLDGREVGEVYASKSKVGGRVAYAVRDISVRGELRRQGIATALYEAAAQEACQRRAALASVERTPNAHSHNFWWKQLQKGRARTVGRGKHPKYVLDCAFASDLSGRDLTGLRKRRKRLVDTCVFRRGASAKKACEKMAAAAVGDRGRRRRSGLGDAFAAQSRSALRDSQKAEALMERTGYRLEPVPEQRHPRRPGTLTFDVVSSDGAAVGAIRLDVGDFVDEVPNDADGLTLREEAREGLTVTSIGLEPVAQRRRLGTKLYEIAAEIACNYEMPLVSDRLRSPFAEAFWRKQVNKGRARAVMGRGGGVYERPLMEAKEALYEAAQTDALKRRGVDLKFELSPAAQTEVREEAWSAVETWLNTLPRRLDSGTWAVERYVLDDPCTQGRDLTGLRKRRKR